MRVDVHVQPRASRSEIVGAVRVVAGATSRSKTVEIEGTTEHEVRALASHRGT